MAASDERRESLRRELLEMNVQRDKIEREIREWMSILKSQNVGMNDQLVDNEGFPRNDIDIHQIRTARNKIICLQNDARSVMRQIEEKLNQFHEHTRVILERTAQR